MSLHPSESNVDPTRKTVTHTFMKLSRSYIKPRTVSNFRSPPFHRMWSPRTTNHREHRAHVGGPIPQESFCHATSKDLQFKPASQEIKLHHIGTHSRFTCPTIKRGASASHPAQNVKNFVPSPTLSIRTLVQSITQRQAVIITTITNENIDITT